MRILKYHEAINEALHQLMEADERVFLIGQGCTSPWYVGKTCEGLAEKFGQRVIDTPISESAMTGAACGMAMVGMRPILMFPRMDFMMYAMDALINQIPKIHYMFGGAMKVPLVIWAIINRGGSQGSQHSQDFTWLFEKIPGLTVIKPLTPFLVKGFFIAAIRDDNPVIIIDNRARYEFEGDVPEKRYMLPLQPLEVFRNPGCPAPASEVLEKEYYRRLK